RAHPPMHVVVAEILAGAAEIPAAAATKSHARREPYHGPSCVHRPLSAPNSKRDVRHFLFSACGAAGRERFPLPVRCRRCCFLRSDARFGSQEGSAPFLHFRGRRHPCLSPAGATPPPAEIR